jgi:hypothetical protein
MQFVGEKHIISGEKKTIWVSRIFLYPNTTYNKADYFYTLNKGENVRTNVAPIIETGYWSLNGNTIFLFSKKDFNKQDFIGKYKLRKNFLKNEWRAFRKKIGNKKSSNANTDSNLNNNYRVKTIVKFKKIKLLNP